MRTHSAALLAVHDDQHLHVDHLARRQVLMRQVAVGDDLHQHQRRGLRGTYMVSGTLSARPASTMSTHDDSPMHRSARNKTLFAIREHPHSAPGHECSYAACCVPSSSDGGHHGTVIGCDQTVCCSQNHASLPPSNNIAHRWLCGGCAGCLVFSHRSSRAARSAA